MKKIFKRGIAILLCFAIVFNYSFSVLANENVESNEPETAYIETINTTESSETTESIEEEIGEEAEEEVIEEEALNNSSEEIIEPEDDNEDTEDAYENEPEETLGDTFEEPIRDNEDIDNTELEDELGNNDDAFNDIENNTEEIVTEINNEVDVDKEIDTEDIEYASPSEADEELDECLEEEIVENIASNSDVDEIIEDIETATQSEIKESTDYFIREKVVDKIKITLTADKGVFPENAELFVEKVEDEHTKEVIDEVINKEKDDEENKTSTLKFDIKVLFNGEEIQPDTEKGTVKVAFTFEEKIENSENINAYHLKEDKNGDLTAEKLDTEVTIDDTNSEKEVTKIEAETDGFSFYAIELPNNLYGSDGSHPSVTYNGQNWMSHIPNNTPIGRLSIPGTHDSGTYHIFFDSLDELKKKIRNSINKGMEETFIKAVYVILLPILGKRIDLLINGIITKVQKDAGTCQDLTIQQQLDAGVRAFDFRFRYDGGQWGMYHGCNNDGGLQSIVETCVCHNERGSLLTLPQCFTTIKNFLQSHPTEMVFLNVQNEGGEYNKDIEKKLLELEKSYGICGNYVEREFAQTVLNENPSLKMTVPSGKLGNTALSNWRGKAIDITDCLNGPTWKQTDKRYSWWSGTKEEVVKKTNAIDKIAVFMTYSDSQYPGILQEVQTNVMVKMYKINDPHGECGLPFEVTYIPKTSIPISIIPNIDRMIKTPRMQASYVNPKMVEGLDRLYEEKGYDWITDYYPYCSGTGIVTMDFLSESNCYHIVRLSEFLTNGPKFNYSPSSGIDTKGVIPYEESKGEEYIIEWPVETLEYLKSLFSKSNSDGSSGDSSGGTPRYDSEGNVLGPSGKQSYTYDGTNPPNLTGDINVSSWNYATGTSQSNNIKYVQNTDSFVRTDNMPVVTEWVGVTTDDIGKVMWYRTDAIGKILKNQFIQIGTNIYYLDNNGIMVTGQFTINGKVYNFDTTTGATEGRFLY